MSDEIKVGDRVKEADMPTIGTVIGRHRDREGDEWAWVETEGEADCQCYGFLLSELTRIEPAEPQPKFPVGQEVEITGSICHGQRAEVIFSAIAYKLKGQGAIVFYEDELEAVPEVCPTCKGTGKRDGD